MKHVLPLLYSPVPWLRGCGHDTSMGAGCRDVSGLAFVGHTGV